MKKSRRKSEGLKFELIGGIFAVETFSDGSEKREEIDGKQVLELLVGLLEQALQDRKL